MEVSDTSRMNIYLVRLRYYQLATLSSPTKSSHSKDVFPKHIFILLNNLV